MAGVNDEVSTDKGTGVVDQMGAFRETYYDIIKSVDHVRTQIKL